MRVCVCEMWFLVTAITVIHPLKNGVYSANTHSAFNVLKNTKNWLQIDSVDQKLFKIQYTVCGNFSQGAGTSGTGSDIAFSQLAVKGLRTSQNIGIWKQW
jgi:hypothetical protein